MKIKIYTLLLLALFAVQTNVSAQEERNAYLEKSSLRGMEYQIKGGFSIGGVSPIPMPAEIRSIDSYNPTFLVALEGNATKWFSYKWGMTVGIRLEDKGMKTDAKVKNYNMVMTTADQGYLEGAWTGNVKTKVRNSYLTFPVLASYKISPRWVLRGGLYVSYMADGEFSGTAYDGYLRNEDPTGEKVFVTEATYDFSDDLRKFAWGAQLSGEWRAFKHLNVYADLTWGLNNIFKSSFDVIEFNMYPIYLNVGFAYVF